MIACIVIIANHICNMLLFPFISIQSNPIELLAAVNEMWGLIQNKYNTMQPKKILIFTDNFPRWKVHNAYKQQQTQALMTFLHGSHITWHLKTGFAWTVQSNHLKKSHQLSSLNYL